MYKACIFDLDGTLADTLESLTYSVNATLAKLGLPEITSEQCESFIGSGAKMLVKRSIEAAGGDSASLLDEAMTIYGRIFDAHCTYQVTPYDGIVEMLQSVKELGISLAVLSNKPHEQTIKVVNDVFGSDVFSFIQGQREDVPRKPDPTGAFMVTKALGVEPSECLYIGDSDVDMQTGCAAGMDSVGVTWGFRSREVLQEYGAMYLVDKAEEILEIVKEKE